MITEQLPRQPKSDEACYPSADDMLVDRASRDERVGQMAVRFMEIDFEVDRTEVLAIAADYNIAPDDVTERACLINILRKMDEVTDGEA